MAGTTQRRAGLSPPAIDLFQKGYNEKKGVAARLIHNLKSVAGYLVEYFYFTIASFVLSLYVLMKHGFDAVHAHNPPDTLFLIGAFYRLFGKKFVFDHHDVSPELYLSRYGKTAGGLVYRSLMLMEKLSFRTANMVIATNASYKKIAEQRGGKKPEEAFIVRNGPDLTRFKPVAPDKMLKKMNKTILGYVGEMGPQDGLDYL
ncbi:MAG: glycosyltransferase [bacterium]